MGWNGTGVWVGFFFFYIGIMHVAMGLAGTFSRDNYVFNSLAIYINTATTVLAMRITRTFPAEE